MIDYNFQGRFVRRIEQGIKVTTIRMKRKNRHVGRGELFAIRTGKRSKFCRLVGTAFCQSTEAIAIDFEEMRVEIRSDVAPEIRIIEQKADLDDFAQRDGFDDWPELHDFMQSIHGPILRMKDAVLITWSQFKPKEERQP